MLFINRGKVKYKKENVIFLKSVILMNGNKLFIS